MRFFSISVICFTAFICSFWRENRQIEVASFSVVLTRCNSAHMRQQNHAFSRRGNHRTYFRKSILLHNAIWNSSFNQDEIRNATGLEIKNNGLNRHRKNVGRAGGRRDSDESSRQMRGAKSRITNMIKKNMLLSAAFIFSVLALLWVFLNFRIGAPNYVYYKRSLYESTVVTSDGKVVRERREDFKSNLPNLRGQSKDQNGLQSSEKFGNLDIHSPPQIKAMEQIIEQEQLQLEEDMKEIMESILR
mmetsp:Transcript_15791/g.22563  ORF Transcript_15791/g.22563 Transcript_15791/m.22563 type:complete len:246 (+) Transcript_15791:26-763(+)